MASLSGEFNLQEFTDLGALAAGYRLYTYAPGTTTQKVAYTDAAGTIPQTYTNDGLGGQYIALNARGELPAPLFLTSGGYDIALKTPIGATVWTRRAAGTDDQSSILTTNLASTASASAGPALVGFNPTLSYATSTLGRRLAQDFWNVCDFPWLATGNGTTEDTAALNACILAASAAGAGVYIPPGTYQINSAVLRSNTHIRGAGQGKTILRQISGANDLWHTADPGSATTYTSNIVIEDLTLKGTVATDGFQEVLHLMFTQGASDMVIQRVTFTGFRGDGLYIGTGNERGQNPSQIRHNKNIRVLDCYFDGEVKNNRNGISVIDCDGCWIERNYFTRISRSDMPGPVDIEPDGGGTPAGVGAIVRDINVAFNKFYDNAGQGMINVNFPNDLSAQTVPIYGINIIGNDMDTSASTYGAGVSINGTVTVTRAIPDLGITVFANTTKDCYQPFFIRAVRGVTLMRNNWGPSKYSAQIGDSAGVLNTLDVRIDRDVFNKVASDNTLGGTGLFIYGADGVSVNRSFFDTCGKANATYNANIALDSGGTKSNISTEDNTFYQPSANPNAYAVRRDAGVLSPGTTRNLRNRLVNIGGGYVNYRHDYLDFVDPQSPSLVNGWTSYGAPFRTAIYWKDGSGTVRFQGAIKSGTTTAGTVIFNLPTGFRPVADVYVNVVQNTGAAVSTVQLRIFSSGDVQTVNLTSNNLIDLTGVSFLAEA